MHCQISTVNANTTRPFRTSRISGVVAVACMLLFPHHRLLAQAEAVDSRASPVADLIARAKDALNNFKYANALTIGREVLQFDHVRPSQMAAVCQVMAAAFFPEEGGTMQADSAVVYLKRAIRVAPEAPLNADLRWSGLDSLFTVTRNSTFASTAKPALDNALTGVDGRAFVEVFSTRPAAMTLYAVSQRGGRIFTHDSTPSSSHARLALRAHDGTEPQFVTGEYEIRVVVRDLQNGSTDTLRFTAMAVGAPPALDVVPHLDPRTLLPDRASRATAKGITAGVMLGAATVLASRYIRAGEPVRSSYTPDGRAVLLGVSIAAGSIIGGFLDKGLPLPANVAANTIVRAESAGKTAVAIDNNRKLVAGYRVELRIETETRR